MRNKLIKVLVPYQSEVVNALRELLNKSVTIIQCQRTPEDMLRKGHDAVIVVAGRVPREFILQAPKLKMIQTFGAGIDKIDREAVLARGDIIVCNCHVNAPEVAEYAIMLLLALAKNILPADSSLRKGDWEYTWGGSRPNIELRSKKCLLIGLGNIGCEIAKRLKAFAITIYAINRSGRNPLPEVVSKVSTIYESEPLVRDADFIIIAAPLTSETRGLVNSHFLSMIKPSALLVNISRGEIIDESALYASLQEGKIAGAALDVWWNYPKTWGSSGVYPSQFPYHQLENVILSPHRAAYSEQIRKDQLKFVAQNILRFLNGETPENIVDMSRGY